MFSWVTCNKHSPKTSNLELGIRYTWNCSCSSFCIPGLNTSGSPVASPGGNRRHSCIESLTQVSASKSVPNNIRVKNGLKWDNQLIYTWITSEALIGPVVKIDTKGVLSTSVGQSRDWGHVCKQRCLVMSTIAGTLLVEVFIQTNGSFTGGPTQNNPSFLPNTDWFAFDANISLFYDISQISGHFDDHHYCCHYSLESSPSTLSTTDDKQRSLLDNHLRTHLMTTQHTVSSGQSLSVTVT